jgi:integrase
MARRRYQRGSVFLRGKRDPVWVARWREDVIDALGRVIRVRRSEVLGNRKDFPTKKLALRELEDRIAPVNSPSYRAMRAATFAEFAKLWEEQVLTQYKPSTQEWSGRVLRGTLLPYFGKMQMKDVTTMTLQLFVNQCTQSSKTSSNFLGLLRMMWKIAKAWGYVIHDPFEGLVLPKHQARAPFFFNVDEVRLILATSEPPYKTLYWMAAETGMRPGELAGSRIEDLNLEGLSVRVVQSVWAGKVQAPKNANAVRQLAISPELAGHLRIYLSAWRPNPLKLLFASQSGTPLSSGNVWKRHLGPLLDKLGIKRRGLNAFRHTSASFMDRLNMPMTVRQERLGHAPGSPVTLAHYTHSVGEDNRNVADQMGAAWGMVN